MEMFGSFTPGRICPLSHLANSSRFNPTWCTNSLNIRPRKLVQASIHTDLAPVEVMGSRFDPRNLEPELVEKMVYEALVWSSLHGLLVGDRKSQRSGKVPGVHLIHAPMALLPMSFPEKQWKQACEVAPIFNEPVDRVSLDGNFLQEALSLTKKADPFTSGLLDIHSKMLEINKKEEVRLGLNRSDYMLDEETESLHQIELNTISSSKLGLSCLVTELHRMLLHQYRDQKEYNNPRAILMFVVQPDERNMYDQHWLSTVLKEQHQITTIRKTLAEIDAAGKLQSDGTLLIGGEAVAVIYFRAGYAPTDYPSELVSTY